jgi:catechol 2,3-dioxygenase-like lactoylglutathione lyase family enzyme
MRKQSAFMNVVVRKFTGAARRFNPRPSESRPSSPSIRGDAAAAPPAFQQSSPNAWPHEDCANEPAAFFACGERNMLWALGGRVALVLLLLVASLSSPAAVRELGAIGLTVGDLDRGVEFYTKVLPFEKMAESKSTPGAADELLDLSDTQLRIAELKLGDERISLAEHLTNKGRPIPQDSRSFDHWFQHIAIVVSDMDRAYEHLRRVKVKHVSTAPQTLPAWNKDAGGIKAFYFRDPEDHVLEIIWFPPGKGDPKWQQPTTNLFLGVDHTAIVVSDTEKSLTFYHDLLGMRVAGGAENYGVEQEHLNQVFGARLLITALRAERGPGIEFLEYITPPGGRALPDDAKANDLIFWQTWLHVDDLNPLEQRLHSHGARFVSRGKDAAQRIVRDPDGHALLLAATPVASTTASR